MPDFTNKAIEPGWALLEGQLTATGRAQALREMKIDRRGHPLGPPDRLCHVLNLILQMID